MDERTQADAFDAEDPAWQQESAELRGAVESAALKRMPPAPEFLDDEGKRAWSAEGRRLIKAGLLTALDLTMFGTWCIWYSKRDLASRAVNHERRGGARKWRWQSLHQPLLERDFDVLESDASNQNRIRPLACLSQQSQIAQSRAERPLRGLSRWR